MSRSRKPQPIRGYEPPAEIQRRIEKIGATGMDYRRIFESLIDLTEWYLDTLPEQFKFAQEYMLAKAEGRTIAPFRVSDALETRNAELLKPYAAHPWVSPLFAEMAMILLDATEDGEGNLTYTDVLGEVYMNMISHGHNGEFYTPQNVARMMAQMVNADLVETHVRKHLMAAARVSPIVKLAEATGVDIAKWKTETFLDLYIGDEAVRNAYETVKVQDPACGSGVMLLSTAQTCPRWAIDWVLIEFFGIDLSQTAARMAQLNMRLYGLNGWNFRLVPGEERPAPLALPERVNTPELVQLPQGEFVQLGLFQEAV